VVKCETNFSFHQNPRSLFLDTYHFLGFRIMNDIDDSRKLDVRSRGLAGRSGRDMLMGKGGESEGAKGLV